MRLHLMCLGNSKRLPTTVRRSFIEFDGIFLSLFFVVKFCFYSNISCSMDRMSVFWGWILNFIGLLLPLLLVFLILMYEVFRGVVFSLLNFLSNFDLFRLNCLCVRHYVTPLLPCMASLVRLVPRNCDNVNVLISLSYILSGHAVPRLAILIDLYLFYSFDVFSVYYNFIPSFNFSTPLFLPCSFFIHFYVHLDEYQFEWLLFFVWWSSK